LIDIESVCATIQKKENVCSIVQGCV